MVASGLLARRLGLGLVGAFIYVLSMLGGSASATESLDWEGASDRPVDSSVHYASQGTSDRDKLVTYEGHQYTVYWDEPDRSGNSYLKIARRDTTTWFTDVYRFDQARKTQILAPPNERGASPVIAISPADGRLHISWSAPGGSLHYAQSSAGCIALEYVERCTYTENRSQTEAVTERRASSPQFFDDEEGNLYFAYQYGSPTTEGAVVLNRYDNAGRWTSIGRIIDGISGSGRYDPDERSGGARSLGTAEARQVFVDGFQFDNEGRLHVTWSFREWYPEPTPDARLRTHDVYYAYSEDMGRTWRTNWGTAIATAESDPIKVTDTSAMVMALPSGWYRHAAARMELDSNGQPHLITPISEVQTWDPAFASYRQLHMWRTMDGEWHDGFIELEEEATASPVVGSMMFDGGDNLFYVYARKLMAWTPFNGLEDGTDDQYLPYSNFTIQLEERVETFLQIVPATEVTAMDMNERIGIPIGTRAEQTNRLQIRIRNKSDIETFRLLWTTDEEERWVYPGHSQLFTMPRETRFQTYEFEITDSDWRGTLQKLELDFSGATRGSIDVSFIILRNGAEEIEASWFLWWTQDIVAAEASAASGWSSWSRNRLLSGHVDFEGIVRNYPSTLADSGFDIDENLYALTRRLSFPVVEQAAAGSMQMHIWEMDILGDEIIKDWAFPEDQMGWTATTLVSGVSWSSEFGGSLSGSITGNDSAIDSGRNLDVDLSTATAVTVRMKQSAGTEALICWVVDGRATAWSLNRCAAFEVIPDNRLHTYEIPTRGWRDWRGHELTQLRLEPSNDAGVRSGSFKVDRLYIFE